MITVFVTNDKTISQVYYDFCISNLQFHSLTCTCGHSGCLTKHASYRRSVKVDSQKVKLVIQRVKCRICGKTHAILLSSMVPYSQVPLADQQQIIDDYEQGRDSTPVMERNLLIDENTVSGIRRQYRRHWKQRILSAGISVIADTVADCFRHFGRQFMQIKTTPNILFLQPT